MSGSPGTGAGSHRRRGDGARRPTPIARPGRPTATTPWVTGSGGRSCSPAQPRRPSGTTGSCWIIEMRSSKRASCSMKPTRRSRKASRCIRTSLLSWPSCGSGWAAPRRPPPGTASRRAAVRIRRRPNPHHLSSRFPKRYDSRCVAVRGLTADRPSARIARTLPGVRTSIPSSHPVERTDPWPTNRRTAPIAARSSRPGPWPRPRPSACGLGAGAPCPRRRSPRSR